MAEHFLQDPRLTLIAVGFAGDAEAQDGVHLRWSFDPDLGFPPEGFQLHVRVAEPTTMLKVSFTRLAHQLQQQPAPAAVVEGVTVHRRDGDLLGVGTRCDQIGLDAGSSPLVLRFRPAFGSRPSGVRKVTIFGVVEQGGVMMQAMHAERAASCATSGDLTCLGQTPQPGAASLPGCVPFELTVSADAIDAVHVSGCNATLIGMSWTPIAPETCERGWQRLHGPICLPVEGPPSYPCHREPGGARDLARKRLPEDVDLPPGAPRRAALEQRLLGADFDDLRTSLETALGAGGQFLARLQSDNPDDGTSWRYDVVRDALTAAADPYFARVLGLYWVHRPDDAAVRHDYKVEATWIVGGEKHRFCWVVFDRGPEAQPLLPAPTNVALRAIPGAAHVDADGVVNPCEMDVTVSWRRPSVCEMTNPVQSPIAYLVERTDAGGDQTGPYHLVTRRSFEEGGEPEVVPAMIADAVEGPPRFADGYYVDRGPGYGTFHYRVLGRDLFGRTSKPSASAPVVVKDEVPPGPPLNLSAEYADPADPERANSPALAWANRDAAAGDPRRAAVTVRWIWPVSRQLQFPDLAAFCLYYRPGSLNHVPGRIVDVIALAPGEYEVATDIAPVGPDIPTAQNTVDPGALRNEGEEYPILTITTIAGRVVFRVRGNPAAPPLVGPCAFRLGRGTSPTATQTGRAPYPAFRTFELPAHWGGFAIDPTAPLRPISIAADGAVAGPLPAGLTSSDVDVARVLEPQDDGSHWHYLMMLRGLDLTPTLDHPRIAGTVGIGAVDTAGNEGRIAPPASFFAIHRAAPVVPEIVYPPVNYATLADYHGRSWFELTWTGVAGIGYLVYRASDLHLLEAAAIDPAAHRARSADEQRLELQQLGIDPGFIDAFQLVTPAPLASTGGEMRHRDALPGELRNRFVYRIRAVDPAGNLAAWPAASNATCVVVDLPGVPPAPPSWADSTFPMSGGVVLRWVPNTATGLSGYRLYRSYDAAQAEDVRSMTPLFSQPEDEGGGVVTGVLLTRDDAGAVLSVTELAPGNRPPGRLIQCPDINVDAGRHVYYRLVAENTDGHRSPSSERLVVQLPKSLPPAPPAWSPAVVNPGDVTLTWTAAEQDLECLVLRRTDGTIWRPLAPWGSPGAYTFTDADVAAGITYEYRVRVRDRVGHVVDGPVLSLTAI